MIESINAFRFPDGQPHVSVKTDGSKVEELVVRITCADELFETVLLGDALHRQGAETINLTIGYLMGARMDREMPDDERGSHPFTLQRVVDILADGVFNDVRVFDPHSDVMADLFNEEEMACKDCLTCAHVVGPFSGSFIALSPARQLAATVEILGRNTVLVVPDAGAERRCEALFNEANIGIHEVVYMKKKRDPASGKLSGFEFQSAIGTRLQHSTCLIVDDICDGGGTFAGQAELLRAAGADRVNLYVSHGIFSKGYDIAGIDHIFTTDSYQDHEVTPRHVTVLPWRLP